MRVSIIGAIAAAMLVGGCGSDSNSKENVPEEPAGQFSLAVSDSPMMGISDVSLVLSELVMLDQSGAQIRHDLYGHTFNLLDYQGSKSHLVISGIELPVGRYHDVRLTVIQGDGNQGCFVEDGQGRHGLQVTDGLLPVADFEVGVGQHHSITLEVDLYRGLSHRHGEYHLDHSGMWSVDNRYMGHLYGEVDPQWIASCETEHADKAAINGQFNHLAYLYPSEVTHLEQMSDMTASPQSGKVAPVAVAPMMQDSESNWYFAMGHLPEGNYRVGYSCLGHLDDPITEDLSQGEFKMFQDAGQASVEAGDHGGKENVHVCGEGNGGHHGGGHHGHQG
ncbi:DUF4382 domain-containing protein [Shewanella waksmanii]|uniref:DUF4382 domain-containing protein n=1 Tax=Shewanella waksmanii TaxID=213783 RepID=UPI003736BF7E